MKIKLEISNYDDLTELMQLLIKHGYVAWREAQLSPYLGRRYLNIEIDKSCITE